VENISVETAIANIRKYLKNDVATPFFVIVDNSVEYLDIINEFDTLMSMRVSGYCADIDAYPDIDKLCDDISTIKQNALLLGFGESVSLGCNENAIGRLKDLTLNVKVKVIVVCRSIHKAVKSLCLDDRKFDSRHVCFLKEEKSYVIIKFSPSLGVSAIDGFKELLFRLEKGEDKILFVKTSLRLHNSREVNSAYEAIQLVNPAFIVSNTCLPNNLWEEFLIDKNFGEADLFHWRSFLKFKLESTTDVYLKYVADTSSDYDAYKKRIFCALLDLSHSDNRFAKLYDARKALLKAANVKDIDIAEYIAETKVKDNDRIYYLTDNTVAERKAIIESLNGITDIPNAVKDIYPALYEYLSDFSFTGDKGELLTNYFAEYKRLKLTNRLTPEFYEQVLYLAVDGNRPYNSLKTRGEVIDNISKNNCALYWIDAFGAEYLGYVQCRAHALGLKITVHEVRANLPTITSFNSDFYEAWSGYKEQTKELDKIKHEGEKDFNYQTIKTPVHLAEELRIVDDALNRVKIKLAGKDVEKVILVSDHGTSRLAVINENECKWEMKSRGKHSGRCCPCSEADVKSEYATKENDFWVLANYDRFKGGRKASVEVHGGATLEEVVIPLIEIALFDNKIDVTNTTPLTTASFKKNAEIVLFSKNALQKVSVRVCGRNYAAEPTGNNKHKIIFDDIKRAGNYTAYVFAGDNLIGQVKFDIQSESGKSNDSDWF
jgi:hypothetical protein